MTSNFYPVERKKCDRTYNDYTTKEEAALTCWNDINCAGFYPAPPKGYKLCTYDSNGYTDQFVYNYGTRVYKKKGNAYKGEVFRPFFTYS